MIDDFEPFLRRDRLEAFPDAYGVVVISIVKNDSLLRLQTVYGEIHDSVALKVVGKAGAENPLANGPVLIQRHRGIGRGWTNEGHPALFRNAGGGDGVARGDCADYRINFVLVDELARNLRALIALALVIVEDAHKFHLSERARLVYLLECELRAFA